MDQRKMDKAAKKGITLIHIPFWWDWSMERYPIEKKTTKKFIKLKNNNKNRNKKQ